MALRRRLAALALAIALAPAAQGQSFGLNPDLDLPIWMRAWSALAGGAILPRQLPGAGTGTSSLLFGAPRVGSFWTAGNPAGLVAAVPDQRTDYSVGWNRQRGDYRRPLDAGATEHWQGSALAWKQMSPGFAMIGRATMDRERLDPGTPANSVEPHGSSPFVLTDSSAAPIRQTGIAFEGGAGWQRGAWRLGLMLGYEAREHGTTVSPIVRRTRVATPGVVAGAVRQLGQVEVGALVRLRRRAETVLLIERGGETIVHELTGFREPTRREVQGAYTGRRVEDAAALGLSLAGRLGGGGWTMMVEGLRTRDGRWRQEVNDPATDRWKANGWRTRGALLQPLANRWILTVHGTAAGLSGSADLASDSAGVIYTADEQVFAIEAELRLLPVLAGWTGTVTTSLGRESRQRVDQPGGLGTDISAGTVSVSVEVGRSLGRRLLVAAGAAASSYGPTSQIPLPTGKGAAYRSLIAPEVDLYASRARPTALTAMVQYRLSDRTTSTLTWRHERLASAEDVPVSAFTPTGDRVDRAVRLIVTVR